MFLYIVEVAETDDGSGLTDRYHDGGGLVIVARNPQEAIDLIDGYNKLPRQKRSSGARILNIDADVLLSHYYTVVNPQEPRIWLFPDAGCC